MTLFKTPLFCAKYRGVAGQPWFARVCHTFSRTLGRKPIWTTHLWAFSSSLQLFFRCFCFLVGYRWGIRLHNTSTSVLSVFCCQCRKGSTTARDVFLPAWKLTGFAKKRRQNHAGIKVDGLAGGCVQEFSGGACLPAQGLEIWSSATLQLGQTRFPSKRQQRGCF